MKWDETTASKCRYGNVAARIFKDAEIIWEHSENDYQGFANVLAKMPDGTFVHYIWTYGSCSGCDEWEKRGLSDKQVEKEMRRALGVLNNEKELLKYVHIDKEFIKDRKVPSANEITNGALPGMLHMGFGGFSDDFKSMAKAVAMWISKEKRIKR